MEVFLFSKSMPNQPTFKGSFFCFSDSTPTVALIHGLFPSSSISLHLVPGYAKAGQVIRLLTSPGAPKHRSNSPHRTKPMFSAHF